MEVREQSPTRLVISTSTNWLTYMSGVVALGLGLLLIFGESNVGFSNITFKIIGSIAVVASFVLLLGPAQAILTVDKESGQLAVTKRYLFGLLPVTRIISINEIRAFIVQHQVRFKLRSPALKLIFKSSKHNVMFYSQNLHYDGKGDIFSQLKQNDARNSDEERLIPTIENYTNMPSTTQERGIDSSDISERMLFVGIYLIVGLIVAFGLTWFYYHIIHAK